MSLQDQRSLLGTGIDEATYLKKSPAAEGFVAGLKAALLGAPVGALVQGIRGENPATGALIGALIPGLIAGLARAGAKKVENLGTEAELRYHANNIRNREPMFFMPQRPALRKYFSRRFEGS